MLPMILGPVLLLVAACFVVPSRWLALHAENTYLANLGYGATLHGADCAVVIYGDSSAMVGVNPKIIQARTGLSACNIAEFEGMTILNGTMVLDRYLAQNKRPRYLIFLYTPEDYDPGSQRRTVGMFEATTWRMRQGNKLAGVVALMRYPDEFFGWTEQGLRLAVERSRTPEASAAVQNFRTARDGQLPLEGPVMTQCESIVRPKSVPDVAWMDGLKTQYGVDGTTVLLDATPLPPCDPKLAYFREHLAGLVDSGVQVFPLSAFTSEGRLHANATGSAMLSNMIAGQIADRMRAGGYGTGAR
jgi:hypothetical protein